MNDPLTEAKLFVVSYITARQINIMVPHEWDDRFAYCCSVVGDALIQFEPGSGYSDISPIAMAVRRLRRQPYYFHSILPALIAHAGYQNLSAALAIANAWQAAAIHALLQPTLEH